MIKFESNGWTVTASYRRAMPNWWCGHADSSGYQGGIRTRLYVQIEADGTRLCIRANNMLRGERACGDDGKLRCSDIAIEHVRVYDENSRMFMIGLASLVDNMDPKWHIPWRFTHNPKARCMHTHGPTLQLNEGEPLPRRGISYALSMALLNPPGTGRPYDIITGLRDEHPFIDKRISAAIRRHP